MQAIELDAEIQANGQINLPEIYKNWFGKHAKIIVLECNESKVQEKTAFEVYSELDLGEGDASLVSSMEVKQRIKTVLQQKIAQ